MSSGLLALTGRCYGQIFIGGVKTAKNISRQPYARADCFTPRSQPLHGDTCPEKVLAFQCVAEMLHGDTSRQKFLKHQQKAEFRTILED
jgi:hypothetical protein